MDSLQIRLVAHVHNYSNCGPCHKSRDPLETEGIEIRKKFVVEWFVRNIPTSRANRFAPLTPGLIQLPGPPLPHSVVTSYCRLPEGAAARMWRIHSPAVHRGATPRGHTPQFELVVRRLGRRTQVSTAVAETPETIRQN